MTALQAAVDLLATEDLTNLTEGARAQRLLRWQRLLNQQQGHWLQELAVVDARGAAGAEQGSPAPSTASWLRNRLRMSASAAASAVRTARALFRGPLTQTAQALCAGDISVAHAAALAHGTSDLPTQVAAEAEPVLLEAARRLDPPRLRRVISHLQQVTDPDGADEQAERRHQQRWLWLAPTWEGKLALQGLLEPEAGAILLAALEPLARPHHAQDARSGDQRRADALVELARRTLEAGQLPTVGGVRPHLTVVVELDSLAGPGRGLGGDIGGAGPLTSEACRRLACDSAVTRVLVTRHPTDHGHHDHGHDGDASGLHGHEANSYRPDGDPHDAEGLTARLQTAMALLPPILGGAPSQPLDVGRTSRVITAAQHRALAVRDNGCVFPDCQRPLDWCDGHHLVHWLDGGPTNLDNLALLCRHHHRAVHEGGWRLIRGPDGRFTATPPDRPGRPHRTDPADRHRTGDNRPGLNPPRRQPARRGQHQPHGWQGEHRHRPEGDHRAR
jgi:Domain of unknown function (DUF222)/HNH endonuclease